jgi:hypothetical protein
MREYTGGNPARPGGLGNEIVHGLPVSGCARSEMKSQGSALVRRAQERLVARSPKSARPPTYHSVGAALRYGPIRAAATGGALWTGRVKMRSCTL